MAPTQPTMFKVYDLNAREGTRWHDFPGGVRYGLKASEPTDVPEHHALLLLRDSSFRVIDDQGKELASIEHLKGERDPKRELAEDETIARYVELTKESLLARAVQRPGAAFTRQSTKDELIAFLMTAPIKADLPRHLRARDTSTPENDADLMGPDAAGAALGSNGVDPATLAAEADAQRRAALMGG